MTSTIPARQLRQVAKAQTAPFPTKQLVILGKSPPPSINTVQKHLRFDDIACRPIELAASSYSIVIAHRWLISTLPISLMSHLRAHRLHVHLPLRLLHGLVFQYHLRHPPNRNLRRNGHILICLRRVLIRCRLGSDQRQGGKETSASRWSGRDSAQYAGIWICSKPASCARGASLGRIAQWVRPDQLRTVWLNL